MKGKLNILEGRQHGDEIVELKDETDIDRPPRGQFGFREACDIDAPYPDESAVHVVKGCNQIEKRALSRTRWSHQRQEFPFRNIQVDIHQDRDRVGTLAVGFVHVLYIDNRCFDFHSISPRSLIFEPFFNRSGGFSTTWSPTFTPSRTSTISPIGPPRLTGVSTTLSPLTRKTVFLSFRLPRPTG